MYIFPTGHNWFWAKIILWLRDKSLLGREYSYSLESAWTLAILASLAEFSVSQDEIVQAVGHPAAGAFESKADGP